MNDLDELLNRLYRLELERRAGDEDYMYLIEDDGIIKFLPKEKVYEFSELPKVYQDYVLGIDVDEISIDCE